MSKQSELPTCSDEVQAALLKEFIDTHPTVISDETLKESEDFFSNKNIIVDLGI